MAVASAFSSGGPAASGRSQRRSRGRSYDDISMHHGRRRPAFLRLQPVSQRWEWARIGEEREREREREGEGEMGTFDGVNDGGRERVGRGGELIGYHRRRERFVDGKKLYF